MFINFLTKKLYQYICPLRHLLTRKKKTYLISFLTFFSLIVFLQLPASAAWTTTAETYDKKTTDPDYGTCYEQTSATRLAYNSFDTGSGSVLYSAYDSSNQRYSKYCANVDPYKIKCATTITIAGCPRFALDGQGATTFIVNDEGNIDGIQLFYNFLGNLSGWDASNTYASYTACKTANKISIAGFKKDGTFLGHYDTLQNCKDALVNAASVSGVFASVKTVNGCSFTGNASDTKQQALVIANQVTFSTDVSHRCSCSTQGIPRRSPFGIYRVDASGTTKTFFTEYATEPGYSSKATECLDTNTARFYGRKTKKCYGTLDACTESEKKLVKSQCTTQQENKYFIGNLEYTTDQIKRLVQTCSSSGTSGGGSFCQSLSSLFQCRCSTSFNPSFDPVWCAIPINSSDPICVKVCLKFETNFNIVEPVTINSPLALIKVVVNFLFWLAVVIFIINILSAALDFIKGGDQPDKLKEASDRITGTIFGFVFLLVASGVINYIIERVNEFIP